MAVVPRFCPRQDLWFATDYDDRNWQHARVVEADMRAHVYVPPASISGPRRASWITPWAVADKVGTLRREFTLDRRPTCGWLRLTSTTPYRLAVNGVWVDIQEESLGLGRPTLPKQRTYDLTPALHTGRNAIAVQCLAGNEVPHILADFEVEDVRGHRYLLGSDNKWVSHAGFSRTWHETYVKDVDSWQACNVEVADMGLNPLLFEREVVTIDWPNELLAWDAAWMALDFGLMAALAVAGCFAARRFSRHVWGEAARFMDSLVYLSLVPSTILCAALLLATYDPRVAQQDIYRPIWFVLIAALVPAQWAALYFFAQRKEWSFAPWKPTFGVGRWQLSYAAAIVLIMLAFGTWLRVRHLTVEPIHHDEVSAYWFTVGILEGGFPGGQPQKDIPYGYSATSELTYFPSALLALVIDDPVLVLRIPSVLWSVALIPLMYYVGKRMWGPWVGITACALYTFSPYCIEMSNFGRYFAQLQFFTVLTVYFFWETIRGSGPINRRALWMTGLSFLAMYFSWEGSGFLALGLVPAALLHRRGNLKSMLCEPMVWLAMLVMVLGFLIQDSHRIFQQTQRLWWGMGISDLELFPMWRYPTYLPSFYFVQLAWLADAFLPLALLVGAIVLAIRHPWQKPLRVLLITITVTTGTMTALLPLRAGRYTYHLTPLAMLVGAVVLVALVRRIYQNATRWEPPAFARRYGAAVAAMSVAAFLAVGNGMTLQLTELYANPSMAYRLGELKFPHWEEPLRYVREHWQPGDTVIATFPHLVDHTMFFAKDNPMPRGWTSDYWLQSTLMLQATLDDKRSVPLDRRAGTVMLPTLASLKDALARNRRVWLIVSPGPNNGLNDRDVNAYLRQNMDVVYEDFLTAIMVRDSKHRPVKLLSKDDVNLRFGKANFLP